MSASLVLGLGWQLGDELRLELVQEAGEENPRAREKKTQKLTVFASKEFQVRVSKPPESKYLNCASSMHLSSYFFHHGQVCTGREICPRLH